MLILNIVSYLVSLVVLAFGLGHLEPIHMAVKVYPGHEIPLDQISIIYHDTCSGVKYLGNIRQISFLNYIDGQKINKCSPLALLPGKHVLELTVHEAPRAFVFNPRVGIGSPVVTKPYYNYYVTISCQVESGESYRLFISSPGFTGGYCTPTGGEGIIGQFELD